MKLFQVMQKAEKRKQAGKCSLPAMMFSLEPRIMFDAAALATGMDVIDHPLPNGPEAMGQVFVDENEALVMTISPENHDVYISGGAEQDMFEVDSDTGKLMFKSPVDFENPRDEAGENTYHVELSFPGEDGSDVKAYTVIVKDVFEPDLTVETPENQTAVTNYLAEPGAEGEYQITGGVDKDLFSIDQDSGTLRFKNAPDYEIPGDDDSDNVYEVQVSYSDPSYGPGDETPVNIAVPVTDVDEYSPAITSPGVVNINENQTDVMTVAATDPNPDDTLSYSLAGGADHNLFTIDSSTGELAFTDPPDFENPMDADGNQVYQVEVQVSDGTASAKQEIFVTVNDVNEAPSITSLGTVTVNENSPNGTVVGSATAMDPEGDSLSYAIINGNLGDAFAMDANGQIFVSNSAALDFETTPTYNLTVQATETGSGVGSVSLTDTAVITINLTDVNEPPVVNPIPDQIHYNDGEWVFQVPNGTFTDPDGDSLAYSVSGLPSWMRFDPQTQIFRGTPHRSLDGNIYTLTVNVDDGQGGQATDVFNLTLRMVVASPPPLSYYVPIIGDGVGGESNSGGSDIGNVTDINGTSGNIGNTPGGGSGYSSGGNNGYSNPGDIYTTGNTTTFGYTNTTGVPHQGAQAESGNAQAESGNAQGESGDAQRESGSAQGESGDAQRESGNAQDQGPPGPETDGEESGRSNESAGTASESHEGTGKTPLASRGKLSFSDQCKQQKPLPA